MSPAARTLAGEIRGRCTENADRPAIHFVSKALGDRTVTWGELLDGSEKVAREIQSNVPANSGVVVIVLDHCMELLYSLVGSLLAGRVPTIFSLPSMKMNVPKYFELLPKLMANADADLLITDRKLYDQFRGWNIPLDNRAVLVDGKLEVPGTRSGQPAVKPPPPDCPASMPDGRQGRLTSMSPPGDAVLLQYSSGTTGLRKGVALNDAAILHQLDAYGDAIRISPSDVIVSWLPLYHDMGLIACCMLPLAKGVPTVWISPFEWVVDPAIWFHSAHKFRATLSWMPNFSYNFCATKVTADQIAGVDLSSMRLIVNCAEPVRADSHRAFAKAFGPFGLDARCLGASYALAENTYAVTEGGVTHPVIEEDVDPADFFRRNIATPVVARGQNGYSLTSSGRPFTGQEVRIVDAERRPLPARHVGELAIRSKCLMSGYYKNEDVSAKAMDADGWFYTGDLGYLTADNDLFVTGRIKDMIIVAGVNIYPSDIEYMVSNIPGVHPGRVVAFGVYDEAKGTEELVVVAEKDAGHGGPSVERDGDVNRSTAAHAIPDKQVEVNIRRQVSMCAECPVSDIRLVPHMWLHKSSSGKIARGANKEKYIREFAPGKK